MRLWRGGRIALVRCRARKRFVASVNESRSEPTRVLCDRKKDSKYRWQIYFKQTNTMMIR